MKTRIKALAVLAVALAAAGYLLARIQPVAPPVAVEKLSIALPMLPHFAMLHIAAEKGFFAEEGLDVTIVPVTHGKAAMEHLRQDKADLAAMADVVFLLAIMKGEALGIAANTVGASRDHAVVARRDRGIATPRDLAGKKIAATFGTSGEYFLWAFLIRHKLAPDLVTLVDVPPGQIAQALASGAVDAAATWEPNVYRIQSVLGENAATFTANNSYSPSIVLVGRSDFLRGHPGAMERLVRALLKAEQFNRSHVPDALNLVAGRLQVEVNALQPTWKEFDFRVDLLQSLLVTLEDQARWAMARGYAEKGPVPNFLPHLYLDALLAVQPDRVTVVH